MNSGLQLGRDNNYKCVWNPTALMLIVFPSKIVCCFYSIAANCDSTATVKAIFQEGCLELTDLLVFMCVFIRGAVSFNWTWRGWYGCRVISVLASQALFMFLLNSTYNCQVEAEKLNVLGQCVLKPESNKTFFNGYRFYFIIQLKLYIVSQVNVQHYYYF